MNPLLLNRESQIPSDGWFHVVPLGTFHHPSGVDQVIDQHAVEKIVERFNNRARQENFGGLLVDYDHFSDDADKTSEAAGWILKLDNRANGVWAQIDWSDKGLENVKGKRYKYVSPVFSPSTAEPLKDLDNAKRLRVTELLKVALTNDPNLKGMVPLSNREASQSADNRNNQPKGTMKNIALKLGLSAEASEDAILAEVVKLQNRATQAEESVAPLKAENDRLTAENSTYKGAQVESDLEKYSNRFKPESKEAWRKALLANRADAITLLEAIAPPSAPQNSNLPNRATAGVPGSSPPQNPSAAINAAVSAIRNRDKCSFEAAFSRARAEHPSLFAAD